MENEKNVFIGISIPDEVMESVRWELEDFWISENDLQEILSAIKDRKVNNKISPSKIKAFLEFVYFLEEKKPTNEFKIWLSNSFPFHWKNILIKSMSAIDEKEELDNATSWFINSVERTINWREIRLNSWASIFETWESLTDSVIIHLPMFVWDNPWTLSDWFELWWEEKWFTSFWWWRSAYTRELEKIHSWKPNRNLVWYVNYPRKWKFKTWDILDELVELIKSREIGRIAIHWASMWWKVALELAVRLSESKIKIDTLFINWWAISPEFISIPVVAQEIAMYWYLRENFSVIPPKALVNSLSFVEAFLMKYVINQLNYSIANMEMLTRIMWEAWYKTDGDRELNNEDLLSWDRVNRWDWLSIRQLLARISYLKKTINFWEKAELLRNNIWRVISIRSITKRQEGWNWNDWMVLNTFDGYLRELFWNGKVETIDVKQVHYMVPNSPWIYAQALNK